MTRRSDIETGKAARGVFITFEGGEGAGKSTQIAHLGRRLEGLGRRVMTTREPGGSEFAEAVRGIVLIPATAPVSALAQMLAFYAARADHLEARIRPAVECGTWVLCDRFADSTRAYQGVAGGVDAATLETIDRLVVGATQPDLTLLLDLDPAVGLARANSRRAATQAGAFVAADTFEGRKLDFHQRLRAGFLEIAKANPQRIVVVDAFQNEMALADLIWGAVRERFEVAAAGAT